MSNKANIVTCEFHSGNGVITKGYRIYDEYGKTYNNTWESIPTDDLQVLAEVLKDDDDVTRSVLDFVEENENGISINDTYYDWAEIKHLFKN